MFCVLYGAGAVCFFSFLYGEQISVCVLFLTCELIEEKLVSIEIADILIEYHGIMLHT